MDESTKPEPRLPLTVPLPIWEAVAEAVRPTFADSYLSGAIYAPGALTPRTQTAFLRIMAEPSARDALESRGLRIVQPLPFGHPNRPEEPGKDRPRAKWRPLTDAEYDRASLSAKVEHHHNLAFEAEMKAGPMWKNGAPASGDELSDEHHRWKAIAANHRADAKRYLQIITDAKAASHA